jgi:uncharacterized protein YjbJ (UPF0337 family)
MDKDELKGKAKQAKGSIKEKAGELIGNPDLEAEGTIDRATGKVQEGFGAAKRKVREAADEVLEEGDK